MFKRILPLVVFVTLMLVAQLTFAQRESRWTIREGKPSLNELRANGELNSSDAFILYRKNNSIYKLDFNYKSQKINLDAATLRYVPTILGFSRHTNNQVGVDEFAPLFVSDKNGVYELGSFKKLSWADPNSFEVFTSDYDSMYGMAVARFIYGVNKGQFWFLTESGVYKTTSKIDFGTFEIISADPQKKIIDEVKEDHISTLKFTDKSKCVNYKKYLQDWPLSTFEKAPVGQVGTILTMYTDGTCQIEQIIKGGKQEMLVNGLVLRDKNHLWYYYEKEEKFEEIDSLDASSFEVIGTQQIGYIYKDKNGVYVTTEFKKLVGLDPVSVKIRVYKGKLYVFDSNSVWEVVNGKTRKKGGVRPQSFFVEKKSTENTTVITKTILDMQDSKGIFLIDLDNNEAKNFSNLPDSPSEMESFMQANYADFDLFIDANDPEVRSLTGNMLQVGPSFNAVSRVIGTSTDHFGPLEIKGKKVFLIKSNLGILYKVEISNTYPETQEITVAFEVIDSKSLPVEVQQKLSNL